MTIKTKTEIQAEINRIEKMDPQPGMFEREARIRREYRIEALEWVLNE